MNAGLRGGPTQPSGRRLEILIEVMLAEPVQIFECLHQRTALELGERFDGTVIVGAQVRQGQELEAVHPEDLVRNGVEHLIADIRACEAGKPG